MNQTPFKVEVGESEPLKLSRAVLIYEGRNRRAFATVHSCAIVNSKPVLLAGRAMTPAMSRSLTAKLNQQRIVGEYLPENVLMTDGENTIASRDTPNDGTYAATGYIWQGRVLKANGQPLQQGASSEERTAALDSRLSLICTNMKAKDVEIYTIRVEAGSSTLLENCATSRDHFYNVQDSKTLTSVFESIAGQIAALHLSR